MLSFLRFIDRLFPPKVAYAHCDIPCGIYDPHEAQMAAHTVLRMTILIADIKASDDNPGFGERKKIISQISRLTKVKEDHAEIVKQQIRVIWGDYFKAEHLDKYKDLHKIVFNIMKLASKARQSIEPNDSLALLDAVMKFSEIFWESKGRKAQKISTGYPTEGEIVYPV